MEQGTSEWKRARLGMITASRADALMAKGRSGKPSKTRETYMGELIAERLSGEAPDHFTSAAMQWGTDTEPMARSQYAFENGVDIEEVGFITHPLITYLGASPDGLVGDDGLVEFKCPNSATHISTLLGAPIDRGYFLQMQVQMDCTERSWCDFVSFDPRMNVDLQMHTRRVARDDDVIGEIHDEAGRFIEEMNEKLGRLRAIQAG